MTDLTDEELERRMRRKLLLDGPSRRGQRFTPEERAMADKLVGSHNVERLERHQFCATVGAKPRRFRPTPVFIHYEYWWVGGDNMILAGWKMARIENGHRTDHHWTGDVANELRRLKAAGFTVKEIPIDGAPPLHPPTRPTTGRKSFSERFEGFDPEACQ